jgi:2-polyprenyl-3-methyl-5-hydroxy-6-metoxy-1,4-benzoquinol methylase
MFVFKNKKELIEKKVTQDERILDVGFYGQGIMPEDPNWIHGMLLKKSPHVHALDLDFDISGLGLNEKNYHKASAESFDLGMKFDLIFAGDLIEHLSNPGLFLDSSKKHIAENGRLIISTPNTFNLFNLTEKLSKPEPTVNIDHTCYFNIKTLKQLFEKNGWYIDDWGYLYSLDVKYRQSYKKKVLNALYWVLSKFTNKFLENLIIVAKPKRQ